MIDHSEHIGFMQRVIERFRVEAWKMHETDQQFCHVCAFIGYRMIQTIAFTMALEEEDLPEEERALLVEQLTALSVIPMPSHDETRGPSQ